MRDPRDIAARSVSGGHRLWRKGTGRASRRHVARAGGAASRQLHLAHLILPATEVPLSLPQNDTGTAATDPAAVRPLVAYAGS